MKRLAWCLIMFCALTVAIMAFRRQQRIEGGAGRSVPDQTNMLGFQDCASAAVLAVGRVTAPDHELAENQFAVGDGKDGAAVRLYPLNARLVSVRPLVGDEVELIIRCAQRKGP